MKKDGAAGLNSGAAALFRVFCLDERAGFCYF